MTSMTFGGIITLWPAPLIRRVRQWLIQHQINSLQMQIDGIKRERAQGYTKSGFTTGGRLF